MDSIGTNSEDQIQPSGNIGNHSDGLKFDLTTKCFDFAHLNVQGLCGQNMSKFSQLQAMSKSPVNSETQRKCHTRTNLFYIDGLKGPFRKDNKTNGGGGIMVYVKNGINA